jgi:hypothetical protein
VSQTAVSSACTPQGCPSFMGDPARAPFRTWVEDRQLNPTGFDNQCLDAIPDRTAGMGSHRDGRGLQHGSVVRNSPGRLVGVTPRVR